MNLSSQFLPPGATRTINGVEHHFAGWHLTDNPEFQVNPSHKHESGNMEGADPGDVYTTHDPGYWGDFFPERTHATEVWRRTEPFKFTSGMNNGVADADSLAMEQAAHPPSAITLGQTRPIHEAVQHAAVRYGTNPPSRDGEEPDPDDWDIESSETMHPDLPPGTPMYRESPRLSSLRIRGAGGKVSQYTPNTAPGKSPWREVGKGRAFSS